PLREQQSDGGGQLVLHVVRALERRDDVDAQRAPVRLLLPDAVLPEDLDRAIARPVHADLRARKQAVAQLEADLRAIVQPEEVADQITEVAESERAIEA